MLSILDKTVIIKHRYEKKWKKISNIKTIGIGYIKSNQIGIIITVLSDIKSFQKKIPTEIEGIKIELRQCPEIKAFKKPDVTAFF